MNRKAKATPASTATGPAAPVKAPRKSRAKKKTIADDTPSSDVEVVEGKGKKKREQVNWAKNPKWTDTLVEYLCDNPSFRIKLFSDSTAEAKKEGRAKQVAKDGKAIQCGVLAKHIFANDPNERARYSNDNAKYTTSVETRLRRSNFSLQYLSVAHDLVQVQEGLSKMSSPGRSDRSGT